MFSKKLFVSSLLFIASSYSLVAQTTEEFMMNHIEYTAGNYTPYIQEIPKQTKAPKGYKPFYISHYGRHGSRYHHTANDYKILYEWMAKADSANALTEKGKSVKHRFENMYHDYYDRAGDLTQKGVAQHKGIAHRMVQNFPSVFKKNAKIMVKSSTSVRCVMSMDAFCQQLRVENPDLYIYNESSKRFMNYMALDPEVEKEKEPRLIDEKWSKPFGDLHYRLIHPSRMINQLFSDKEYVAKNLDTIAFMRKFYEVNNSLMGMDEKEYNFDDVWTAEEKYANWVVQNAWWYGAFGPCPMTENKSRFFGDRLLKNIIQDADAAIQEGNVSAHLRFGHDTALLPLTGLMALQGCRDEVSDLDEVMHYWTEYKIIPMAANIQLIFYRSKKDAPILVKILLNEREVDLPLKSETAPYYKWSDVRKFYLELLSK